MSHLQQREFVESAKQKFPEFFSGSRVLECGSLDVNGSVREHFVNCEFIGVDCNRGKGVDVVCHFHRYDSPVQFDVVISCESLEHDPYSDASLANMFSLLRPGGLWVMTAAGPARAPHGVGRFGPDKTHYRNIETDEVLAAAACHAWELFEVGYVRDRQDIQAIGLKSGPS